MGETAKLKLFESAILPHMPAAYNLARWLLRNPQDAEDAVQDACVKAFRFFDGFTGKTASDGRAWLLAIVRNTALSHMRSARPARADEAFEEKFHGKSESPTVEQTLLGRADLADLRDCIENLPSEYREAIVLREMEELSYKEIAEAAAVPVGTIMSRLARARKRLAGCMKSKNMKAGIA